MQYRYDVPNYYTKVNLIRFLMDDRDAYYRVLIFVSNKRMADRLFESLEEVLPWRILCDSFQQNPKLSFAKYRSI